jgi:uncharacterized protein
MKTITKIFLFLAFALFFTLPVNAYYSPGQPAGFVNDFAGLMTEPVRSALSIELTEFQKATTTEIAVVTITSLQEDTIENFAVKLFEEWGIGRADVDNGVLFLIAKDDRQFRIEVGYGLEGALTDIQARRILDEVARPKFQAGDYDGGITSAVAEIEKAVRGEEFAGKNEAETPVSDVFVIIIMSALAGFYLFAAILSAVFRKSKRYWPGGVVGLVLGLLAGVAFGSLFYGAVAAIVYGLIGLGVDYGASRKGWFKGSGKGGTGFWGGGSSSGGSGGGGGFSGGSSGGGGSSSSW